MNEPGRELQRDVSRSSFSEILTGLSERVDGLETAVFFDHEGETIDYHSFLDPYDTRLVAALHGVVFGSAQSRTTWTGLGDVRAIEIYGSELETVTVPVGDDFYLTVVVPEGSAGPELYEELARVTEELLTEVGY